MKYPDDFLNKIIQGDSFELIKTIIAANVGQIVLDPFMGSGTTALACKVLGRDYVGIELSEKYCEVAKNRLSQELLFV